MGRVLLCLLTLVLGVGALPSASAIGADDRFNVRVPNATNMRLETAFAILRKRGLKVSVTGWFALASNIHPRTGGQSPPARAHVRVGTTVRLRPRSAYIGRPVAGGEERIVPDVRGMSLGRAVATLQDIGLIYWRAISLPPLRASQSLHLRDAYSIKSQDPPPGSRLRQRVTMGQTTTFTPVELVVAVGPRPPR